MKFPLISAFLVVLLLSNCASKLTESQKSSLTQVMLNQPIIESGDLKPIDGTESPNASSSVPMSTGGGALPALIGCAIDAGVTKYQAGQFKKQYGSQIEQVQAHVPRNPGNDLHQRATKVLRNDEFFKSRLSASGAPNRIDCDLISYGLVRSSRSQDQTYLGMKITCKVWLTDSKGKALFIRTINGLSADSHTIHDYMSKSLLVQRVYDQALDGFESEFRLLINTQMGR